MFRSWAIAVFAVGFGFVIGGITGDVIASWAGLWHEPISGFAAAFSVVVFAYVAAPTRGIEFSICSFIIGAGLAAWLYRNGSWYPENYAHLAYQTTYFPLWSTLTGGVAGILAVLAFSIFKKSAQCASTGTREKPRAL
jgi:hypothetical protein